MATGLGGGGAAYQKLTTPEDGISRSMQYWGGLFAQQAEANKEREDREKIRKAKEISDWEEKNQANYNDFKQTITGYDTYDDVGRDYTNRVIDKYVSEYNLAEEAMKKGDNKTMQAHRNNLLKLKSTFNQVKDLSTVLAKRNAEYMDMVNKGEMSGVDKDTWEAQNYALLGKNFAVDLDENFNPVIKGITNIGDEGQESTFEIPYSRMVNGDWRPYKRQELVGKSGLVNTVLGSLGTYEEERAKNGNIVTSKLWTPTLASGAEALIKPMLQSDEVMADLTNQFDNSSKKRTGFSEGEKSEMLKKLTGMVEAAYSEKYKEVWDKDYAKLQETMRHNRRTEGIQQQNANTNSRKVAIDADRNSTYKYRAVTDRIKAENERDRNTPDLKQGTLYVDRVKQNGKYQNVAFRNLQLTDTKGVVQPFIVGQTKDKDGNVLTIKASSVDVSEDGTLMKVMIQGQNKPMYISRKGNPKSKALFEKLESQMGNRDLKNVNLFGAEDLNQQPPVQAQQMTDEQIRNKYKY